MEVPPMSSSPSHQFLNGEKGDPVEPPPHSPSLKNRKAGSIDDPNGDVAAVSPELPKAWSLEDPFHFAPPKPDGDPWTLLLEPLLKSDQKRCDSWRDEVQNLLIFAGLFSAVVTSFIIQSYQGLQEDPNATMITLLSRIAARLDAPLAPNSNITTSSQLPSIPIPSFTPSSPTIRVNALWFTSLVLSLTTVLIGTISLQWLREHQTYSDLTPRDMYAVYHMRHESLARWQVDKIFSTMPLLLQSALILFLIGIFDFLRTLDQWAVTAPVAVFIAFTFLFLVATAVLPSVYTLALYFNFFSDGRRGRGATDYFPEAPSPCPYKSPQSHAIRTIVGPLFGIFDNLYPHVRKLLYRTRKFIRRAKRAVVKNCKWPRPSHPPDIVEEGKPEFENVAEEDDMPSSERFTRYLLYASWKARWADFDVGWLAIRDGFMRRAFGREAWCECIGPRDDEIAPLLDVAYGLGAQSYQKATCGAAYACFVEISKETLLPLRSRDREYRYLPEERFYQSAYLHDLLEHPRGFIDVFDLEKIFQGTSPDSRKNAETLYDLLHQQNLYAFMDGHFISEGTLLSNHRKELSLRLSAYFYTASEIMLRSDIDTTQSLTDLRFPSCLMFTPFEALLEPETERDAFNVITWQTANVMLCILQIIDRNTPGRRSPSDYPTLLPESILLNPLIQRTGIPVFIEGAGYFTGHFIRFVTNSQDDEEPDSFQRGIMAKIDEIFTFITTSLEREITSWPTAEGSCPSLLFYVASLYANIILPYGIEWEKTSGSFKAMVMVLSKYKRRTIGMGVSDRALEERLAEGRRNWNALEALSAPWWELFESNCANLGGLNTAADTGRDGDQNRLIRFADELGRNEDEIVVYYPLDSPQT